MILKERLVDMRNIINHWNNLPWATVNSPSINAFKKILMTTTTLYCWAINTTGLVSIVIIIFIIDC